LIKHVKNLKRRAFNGGFFIANDFISDREMVRIQSMMLFF